MVGEEIEPRGHRSLPYTRTVRLKDVRNALRPYADTLREESAASVPESLVPEADVVTVEELAERHGVPESAIESATLPEHERVGRTLLRPSVLSAIEADIEPGLSLSAVEAALEAHDVDETSAVLSRLGYRVEWEGLGGGTVRRK